MEVKRVRVEIPEGLYKRLESIARKKGLAPEIYLVNLLREALNNEKMEDEIITPEEREEIKKRLKELGYL
jgi:metal-responsive CopG/Arc/MetJ family transcriptional regulator